VEEEGEHTTDTGNLLHCETECGAKEITLILVVRSIARSSLWYIINLSGISLALMCTHCLVHKLLYKSISYLYTYTLHCYTSLQGVLQWVSYTLHRCITFHIHLQFRLLHSSRSLNS